MAEIPLDRLIERENMQNIAIVLEQLFDKKILSILRFFLENSSKEYTLSEVSDNTNVPISSTFRILKQLTSLSIITLQTIKNLKIYSLNETETTKFLSSFLIIKKKSPLDLFIGNIKDIPGISCIIKYGKNGHDKANVLVIGDGITPEENKEILNQANAIRSKYGFSISNLTLTEEQYNQMSNMGLYSGEKRILLKK